MKTSRTALRPATLIRPIVVLLAVACVLTGFKALPSAYAQSSAELGTICRIGKIGCVVPAQPVGSRCFCGSKVGTIVG